MAAFTFAPLVVVKAQKIRDVSEKISDILKNQRDANGLKTIVSDDAIDFIAKVIAQILSRPPRKGNFAQFFFLILALIASCAFIIAMIVKSREEPKKFQEKYKRKSLFEYSDDIFKDINQKSQR